jgi:hypothetical protein
MAMRITGKKKVKNTAVRRREKERPAAIVSARIRPMVVISPPRSL